MKISINLGVVFGVIIALIIGYYAGIHRATTSAGWIDNDKFILEVDGQLYEWWIDEE